MVKPDWKTSRAGAACSDVLCVVPVSIPLAVLLEHTFVAAARTVPTVGDKGITVADILEMLSCLLFSRPSSGSDEYFFKDLFEVLKAVWQILGQRAVIFQLQYRGPRHLRRCPIVCPGHHICHNSSSLNLVHFYYNICLHNFQVLLFFKLFCKLTYCFAFYS